MKYNDYEDYEKVDEYGNYDRRVILYNPKAHKEIRILVCKAEKTPLNEFLLAEGINYQVRNQWVLETKNCIDVGDLIIIARGRKMVGEVKRVANKYEYIPNGCYSGTPYLKFTDDTKCSEKNCELWLA